MANIFLQVPQMTLPLQMITTSGGQLEMHVLEARVLQR